MAFICRFRRSCDGVLNRGPWSVLLALSSPSRPSSSTMATSSAPSSGRQNSRFSSLKVFKIASSAPKAPQPPPKDPYYLSNPSLASLSLTQDLPSNPITPVSSRYAASARSPSPSPSYSTSHYAPSTTALSPSAASSATLSPDSASSRRGLFKLPSFTRRPKTPKSSRSDTSDSAGVQDDSISLPWNFQVSATIRFSSSAYLPLRVSKHNIHVDEGYGYSFLMLSFH